MEEVAGHGYWFKRANDVSVFDEESARGYDAELTGYGVGVSDSHDEIGD
ncbi:MAG: hypothetical protein GTN64_02295, partial [Candidatus Latescibacteria bacterium]|nr:hypothetical protein [Candidatus Latescibacterota bacterium]NIO77447.1 hypothetical protein [Candidatus Latescibacterota bacterium]